MEDNRSQTEKDLDLAITWQYDNSPRVCAFVDMLKNFYVESTEDFISTICEKLNLPNAETCDEFGLTIWGSILDTRWPIVKDTNTKINKELYRKILLAKIKFLSKRPTLENYIEYFDSIFTTGLIKIKDNTDMSASFETTSTPTGDDLVLFNNAMDAISLYTAGVKSSEHATDLMFGLAETNQKTEGQEFGGLDESNLNYRITPSGRFV